MLRNYHQNQSSGLRVPSIYTIIFAFSRATRINFAYQCDRHISKKMASDNGLCHKIINKTFGRYYI